MKMMGVAGVALAISMSTILQVSLLYCIWNRRSRNLQGRDVFLFYIKMALMGLLLWFVLKGGRQLLLIRIDATTAMGCLAISAIITGVFAVLFLALGYGLPIKEIPDVVNRLRHRKPKG
jgi:peptidoglycan biosynthesis protein MviN/MurJ (putative lipid II flippase)